MVRTLKEYFGNNTIEHFTEKNAIETVMDEIGISAQKFTGIETTSRISDDRFYVIFSTITAIGQDLDIIFQFKVIFFTILSHACIYNICTNIAFIIYAGKFNCSFFI